jgi:hypothetical protein
MPILPSRARQIQELVARLGHASRAQRDSAIARLTLLGTRAVPLLLASLPTAGRLSRLAVLQVLEAVEDARAAPEVLALCRDRDPEVAAAASRLAAAYPQPRTAEVLTKVLEDGPPEARGAAAETLGRLHARGVVAAIDPLLDLLLDDDEEEDLRLIAFEALSTLPARTLAPVLKRLRASASPALAARIAAWEKDGAAHGAPALELVLSRLREDALSPAEALRLGRALRGFGPGIEPALARALDRAPGLLATRALADALAHRPAAEAIPALARALQRLSTGDGAGPDAAAAREVKARLHVALAAADSRIALYDLREMLLARPVVAAATLLEAAGRVGDKTLVPVVARLAADDAAVRRGCAAAFAAIALREKLRRSSAVVKALRPEHRQALESIWPKPSRRSRS